MKRRFGAHMPIAGGLQTACKNGADEAKKQSSTQLSSPK